MCGMFEGFNRMWKALYFGVQQSRMLMSSMDTCKQWLQARKEAWNEKLVAEFICRDSVVTCNDGYYGMLFQERKSSLSIFGKDVEN